MDLAEAGALLTYAASCDRRIGTPGKQDAIRWADLLEGMTFERCKAAIRKHYQESDEVIMPAHIRRLARTTTDGVSGPVELEPLVTRSGRQVEPHAGEVLCPDCAMVHRRDESCAEFARYRRRELPRPIASTVATVAEALTPALEPPASAVHERALQRARRERGNVPWSRPERPAHARHDPLVEGDPAYAPTEPPPESEVERPAEERDYQHQSGAITLEDLPPAGLGPSACQRCRPNEAGARPVFLDYPAGRSAHRAMFGHDPVGVVPVRVEGVSAGAVD